MEATIEATTAGGTFLEICLLFNGRQSVFVHFEMNIEAFPFVFAILDGSGHCQEAGAGLLSDEARLLVALGLLMVFEADRDPESSDGIRLGTLRVEDLNGLLICIDSRQITLSQYLHYA